MLGPCGSCVLLVSYTPLVISLRPKDLHSISGPASNRFLVHKSWWLWKLDEIIEGKGFQRVSICCMTEIIDNNLIREGLIGQHIHTCIYMWLGLWSGHWVSALNTAGSTLYRYITTPCLLVPLCLGGVLRFVVEQEFLMETYACFWTEYFTAIANPSRGFLSFSQSED